jgi:hypothetical protein
MGHEPRVQKICRTKYLSMQLSAIAAIVFLAGPAVGDDDASAWKAVGLTRKKARPRSDAKGWTISPGDSSERRGLATFREDVDDDVTPIGALARQNALQCGFMRIVVARSSTAIRRRIGSQVTPTRIASAAAPRLTETPFSTPTRRYSPLVNVVRP